MKYLLIITGFFLIGSFCMANDLSSNQEHCAYATQDTHVVSNSSYNNLLARLNTDDEDDTDTKQRGPRKPTRGQR